MRSIKGFTLTLLLGLATAVSASGFVQDQKSNNQKKEGESCCAMASCCCKGESCSTKDGSKNHSSKDGCCCCGDTCDMKMKDKEAKKG